MVLILINVSSLVGSDKLDQQTAKKLYKTMILPGCFDPQEIFGYTCESVLKAAAHKEGRRALAGMLNKEAQPGDTWLKFATYDFSSTKSVALLIEYGADVSIEDERGATPAQYLLYDLTHDRDRYDEEILIKKTAKFELLKKEKESCDLRWLWIGLAQTGRTIDIKPITSVEREIIEVTFDVKREFIPRVS